MQTKHLVFISAFILLFSSILAAQSSVVQKYDSVAVHIAKEALGSNNSYTMLEDLCTKVGNRISGSPQAAKAVQWAMKRMQDLGFENVHLEPVMVPHWVRGPVEEAYLLLPSGQREKLKITTLGGSIATPAEGITAEIVEVKSFDELRALGDKAKGKIVFFNGVMDPTLLDTFAAYGGAVSQRSAGAVAAAKVGAVAAVVRSMSLTVNDDPHTGTMSYEPGVPQIPAVTISTAAADRLDALLGSDPGARLFIRTSSATLPPVTAHNLMGELTGSEKPDEVIVVSGHIDSWDLSVGAHDDGAGCAQSIEALLLIRELGLKPKRTIRAVLFMDEENGSAGGRDYARSDNRKAERHIAAIESDRGGFLPIGMGVGAKGEAFDRIKAWEPLFQRIGLQWIRPGGGGSDIAPLAESGTMLLDLVPDSQRYFDVHHSGTDTLDKVNPRELQLGANAMALMAYLLAEEGIPR